MATRQDEIVKPEKSRRETELEQARLSYQYSLLVEAANKPGAKLGPLMDFMDDHPDFCEQLCAIGNSIKARMIERIASGKGFQYTVEVDHKNLIERLAGDDADPLERLMIERIGLCWLRLLWCENYNASFTRAEVNMRESEYADRLYDRAFKRFTKACESLARLRALRAMAGRRPASVLPLRLADKTA